MHAAALHARRRTRRPHVKQLLLLCVSKWCRAADRNLFTYRLITNELFHMLICKTTQRSSKPDDQNTQRHTEVGLYLISHSSCSFIKWWNCFFKKKGPNVLRFHLIFRCLGLEWSTVMKIKDFTNRNGVIIALCRSPTKQALLPASTDTFLSLSSLKKDWKHVATNTWCNIATPGVSALCDVTNDRLLEPCLRVFEKWHKHNSKMDFFISESLLTHIVVRKHLVKWFLHNLWLSKVILLLPETGNYGFRSWLTAKREWKAGRKVSEAQTAWVSAQSVASGKQNKTCGFAHDDSSI